MKSILLTLPLAYLIGSIPSGLLVVKAATGKDVREIESGRTGGTNAMRAGGPLVGFLTALLDMVKGAAAVWVTSLISSGTEWLSAASGLMAVIGHNYSAFLICRDEDGKLHFNGGAGGATTLGASIGLWINSWMVILPLASLFYIVVGYASLTTISIALSATGVFLVRALKGADPWEYVFFGVAALLTVIIALRPNIQRLIDGNERRVQLLQRVFKNYKKK
jgi:glycerol-3-phosphate acyltransferase PlsY